jgi:FixJ family two-component response regulator
MSEQRVREMCEGPFAFLNKPFRASTMLDTVQELVRNGTSGNRNCTSSQDSGASQ